MRSLAPLDLHIALEEHCVNDQKYSLEWGKQRVAERKYLLLVMEKRIVKVGLSRK